MYVGDSRELQVNIAYESAAPLDAPLLAGQEIMWRFHCLIVEPSIRQRMDGMLIRAVNLNGEDTWEERQRQLDLYVQPFTPRVVVGIPQLSDIPAHRLEAQILRIAPFYRFSRAK